MAWDSEGFWIPDSDYETSYNDLAPINDFGYDTTSTPDAEGMYSAISANPNEDYSGQVGGSWAGNYTGGNYGANSGPYWNDESGVQNGGFSLSGLLSGLNKGVGAVTSMGGNPQLASLLQGLIGGGLGYYGATKQNELTEADRKKHDADAAAIAASANKYSSPLAVANPRTSITPTPVPGGESLWFANNRAPFAEGGLSRIKGYREGTGRDMEAAEREAVGDTPRAEVSIITTEKGPLTEAEKYARDTELLEAEQLAKAKARMAPKKEKKFLGLFAQGGLSQAYVKGGSAGQADKIPAMLSDGEYVFDADSVAALGDGNNEAGAAKLDQMRANIRAHKRSAPAHKIPPKAKTTQAYMKGAK